MINWPDANTQQAISRQFQLQSGLPGIIGCLDGTHIRLSSAPGGDKDYFNRKNFPSIQLQVLIHVKHIFTVCLHDVNYFIINKPGNFKLYETLTLLITYKCRMKTLKIVFFSLKYTGCCRL